MNDISRFRRLNDHFSPCFEQNELNDLTNEMNIIIQCGV